MELEDLVYVENSKNGKGLFAKLFLPVGTFIVFDKNPKILIPEEYQALSIEEKEFPYRQKDGSYVMPSNISKYLNHSCNSNVLEIADLDIVVRDILPGEELTYDYRQFDDLEDQSFNCDCGKDNCCGVVNCALPLPESVKEDWEQRVARAVENCANVTQYFN